MTVRDHQASFAERLRAQRRARGLSLRELSGRSGIAASTISRIENGVFAPTWVTAVSLAQALGVQAAEFQNGLGTLNAVRRRSRSDTAADEGCRSLHDATSTVAVRRQVLSPGVRKDLRRIASARPYRFLVVLEGEVQIRSRNGSRVSLRPGLRLDCDLLRQDAFFAISTSPAELLWIG